MKREMRTELKLGLLCFALSRAAHLIWPCSFAEGALTGLAICLELIGALPEAGYLRLKRFKRELCGGNQ